MDNKKDTKDAITNPKNAKELQEAFKEENNFYKDALRQLGEIKVTKSAEFSARELANQYKALLDNKIRELDKTKDKANTSLKEMYKKEKEEFQESLKKNPLFKTAKSVAENHITKESKEAGIKKAVYSQQELEKASKDITKDLKNLKSKRKNLVATRVEHGKELLALLNKENNSKFVTKDLKDLSKVNSPIIEAFKKLQKEQPEKIDGISGSWKINQEKLKIINKFIKESENKQESLNKDLLERKEQVKKAPSREPILDKVRKAVSRIKESLARNQGQVSHARITGSKEKVYKGR